MAVNTEHTWVKKHKQAGLEPGEDEFNHLRRPSRSDYKRSNSGKQRISKKAMD